MNNYPIWWDANITIYNKHEAANGRISWFRKQLSHTFWKLTGQKVIVGEIVMDSDAVICRIPKNDAFLDKATWDALSDLEKADTFTIAPGDIIVYGNVSDTVDEYVSGQHSTDLMAKYKTTGVMLVERLNIDVGIGRGQEHYYVRGT